MSMNLKALKEQRGKLVTEERSVVDAAGDAKAFTAEQRAQVERIEQEISDIDLKIRIAQRIEDDEAREADANRQAQETANGQKAETDKDELRSQAFRNWAIGGFGALTPEHRSAMQELRAQSVGTNSAGGYLVPRGFSGELEKTMKAYGGMLQVSRIIPTATGNLLDWPTNNDTANKGRLLSENSDAESGSTDLVYGTMQLAAYTFTSDLIRVSNQILQDSAFDLNTEVLSALAERLGRAQNYYYTVGSGSSQPQGVTVGVTGYTSAALGALTFDNLIDLMHSVDPAYRGNASWMFNDATLAVIRKLKDGDNNYIWTMGDTRTSAPDAILGKPYTINQDMASVGTSTKSVLFGDFQKFAIRQVQSVTLRRLEERYADYNQVAFVGFMRTDSKILNTAAIKGIQHAAS